MSIEEIEKAIREIPKAGEGDARFHPTRSVIKKYIELVCDDIGIRSGSSIADCIEAAQKSKNRRNVAIVIIRCFGVDGLIPDNNSENQIDRKILKLCQLALPDLDKEINFSKPSQTFEGFELIRGIFGLVCSDISCFNELGSNLGEFIHTQSTVLKSLNRSRNRAVLAPFGSTKFEPFVKSVYQDLKTIEDVSTSDYDKQIKLTQLKDRVLNEKESSTSVSFFYEMCVGKFLEKACEIVQELELRYAKSFCAKIAPGGAIKNWIEKRYPIKEEGRSFSISLSFRNEGPGIAHNVRIEVDSPDNIIYVGGGEGRIGSVRPGVFSTEHEVLVLTSSDSCQIDVYVTWDEVGGAQEKECCFSAELRAQNPNTDWEHLSKLSPYSTDAVEGDAFIGRSEILEPLCAGFLRDVPQSAYIFGQKRIGKTSLGFAVRDALERQSEHDVLVMYIEWGDFASSSSEKSLQLLGCKIANYLAEQVDQKFEVDRAEFLETLAPLIQLINQLYREHPEKKIVIIVDEFDEIHTDMYRSGRLAEAFFANLRTLSGKRNVGLLLIGGENMSFIMSAQGDQLNRFHSYPLNFLDREREWSDFQDLIRMPVKDFINWHPSALNALFDVTNGHPYYAKLIAQNIYNFAVREKDTDITAKEVKQAVQKLAVSLDINSFSHIWKDGINTQDKGEKYKEIASLQRCRCLVEIGRALRSRDKITIQRLVDKKHSSALREPEIRTHIQDFIRRDLMRENADTIELTIGLLQEWLHQVGVNKLVSDTLGDEYQNQLEQEEENAYVKSGEITELLEVWPPYQLRQKSSDDVRAWLDQVSTNKMKRLMFNLLRNLRFFGKEAVFNYCRAQKIDLQDINLFVQKKRVSQREDFAVVFFGGAGKSGNYCARTFSEANSISKKMILEGETFAQKIDEFDSHIPGGLKGVVIIDDFIGTGDQLSGYLERFFSSARGVLTARNLAVLVYGVCATEMGEDKVRSMLKDVQYENVKFEVFEILDDSHYAFKNRPGIWENEDDYDEAYRIINDYGVKIQANPPLGYGNKGVLVVFEENSPNNTIPLLHSGAEGKWKPLFPRSPS